MPKSCKQILHKRHSVYAAHHIIVGVAFKFVTRFSVFAHWLSNKHLVKTKFAQNWTSVVMPARETCRFQQQQQQQQGKQHHALSIEHAGSRKFYISSLPSALTNACVAGNLAQLISRTRILVSKQRLHKDQQLQSAEQTHLSCHSACHSFPLIPFNTSVTANAPQGKLLRSGQA